MLFRESLGSWKIKAAAFKVAVFYFLTMTLRIFLTLSTWGDAIIWTDLHTYDSSPDYFLS